MTESNAKTAMAPLPLPQPAARDEGTATWLLIVVMVIVVAPMIALSQVIAYWRTDVVDDQMFAYFGWRIAHGATVYIDVWDNKPPGIYWINALGMILGRDSYFGIIGLCATALAISHAAFFVIGATVYRRGAAALGTIFLSFYLTHAFYTGGTNRTETFLVACELCAVALYMRGFAGDRAWKWYAAGLLCGAAFLFKQVGLVAWGAMGLHTIVLVFARRLSFEIGLKRCLLLLGGAATTITVGAAALASQGALSEACFATFGFNQTYFTAGASQFPYNFVTWVLLGEHLQPILLLPLLMAAAGAIHAFLWWARPQYRPAELIEPLNARNPRCPGAFFLFAVWFLVALYGALLSPHGFRHYLVPTIPPLLLMGTYLINVLRGEVRLLRQLQRRAWITAAFVAMAYFAYGAVKRQFAEVSKVWVFRIDPWLFGEGSYQPSHWELVGDIVTRHTGPNDKIQCWGYMPGVYLHARRINACRFTTTEKVGQVKAGADFVLYELEHVLKEARPALMTIESRDYFWLHGRDPLRAPTDITLGPWIDEHYLPVEDIPKFGTIYVFKRRDLVDPDRDHVVGPILPPDSQPSPAPGS